MVLLIPRHDERRHVKGPMGSYKFSTLLDPQHVQRLYPPGHVWAVGS